MKKILQLIALALLFVSPLQAQQIEISELENNSTSDDFAPSLTHHGRVLFFSAEKDGKQQIFRMERTSTGWGSPEEVRGDVNDGEQVGASSLTSDGSTIFFSSTDHDVAGSGRTDVYYSVRNGSKYSPVMNAGPNVNSEYFDGQPSITPDGRMLYFVSDRPGGKGGTDIYTSAFSGGTWSAAKPLDIVNSSANEMSPIIAADGSSLTFASDRPGGQGGYDIYTVSLNSGASPKNIGTPINTSAHEMFYNSVANSNQAYFTRSIADGTYNNFRVVPNPFPGSPVTMIEGKVIDSESKEPVAAKIDVTDLQTGKNVATLQSDGKTGEYFVTLAPGKQYSITATSPGYMFSSERYDVPPGTQGVTQQHDIALNAIGKGGVRLLIFFDFDKDELKSESYPELERIVEFMRENNDVRVQFDGHTDDQGEEDYNLGLSKRRSSSVVKYLVNAGIDTSRMESNGLGESQPLVKETTEEARAKNRRVEMTIKQ